MERIVIEVSEETAKKWCSTSPETKELLVQKIEFELNQELRKENREKLFLAMDTLAETAKENGLTEEILQEILAEDD